LVHRFLPGVEDRERGLCRRVLDDPAAFHFRGYANHAVAGSTFGNAANHAASSAEVITVLPRTFLATNSPDAINA